MDRVLDDIADFAASITYDDLTPEARQAGRERLLDALGCALGAQGCPTAEAGLAVAPPAADGQPSGRVLGAATVRSADAAAFVNSCLIRYLDFNDTYPGGHPSDALGAHFALAPQVGATGRDLITAMVTSYEVFIRLQMAGRLREKGWDQGFGISVGSVAGVGKLLGLSRDELQHAISITAVGNVPMRATRAGQLSYWKGGATAYAVRNAVFGAQLAAQGITGPEAPFTGRHGLEELVTGPLEYPAFDDEFLVDRARIKYWPVVYNMQALVWAGIDIANLVDDVENIASIDVHTYWSAWHESGSEPAKWDPQTRATADHSLPYILAWTLRHKGIDHDAFENPASYQDPSIRPLMSRISVHVDDDIEKDFPDTVRMVMRATMVDGKVHEAQVTNPLGHERNPVAPEDLSAKFRRLVEPVLGVTAVTRALEQWWDIDDALIRDALDLLNPPA